MAVETAKRDALIVDLQIAYEADSVPTERDVSVWLEKALAHARRDPPERCEVGVRIVGEAEIRRLNADYRGIDRPTNVLAFPVEDGVRDALPSSQPLPLGDLVVAADVVAREAAQQGKPLAAHWGHLLVHGMLHLLGYDHESADDALEMEGLETTILAAGGVADPYRA